MFDAGMCLCNSRSQTKTSIDRQAKYCARQDGTAPDVTKQNLREKVNKEVVRPFALFRMQNGKHGIEKLESMYDLSEQSFTQDKRVEVCYRLNAINTPTPLCFLLTQNSTKNLKSKTCSFLHTTHTCKTRTEKFCSLYSLIYCG